VRLIEWALTRPDHVQTSGRFGESATGNTDRVNTDGKRTALNWILALLTVPAALAVVAYAYLQVLGTARCSDGSCGRIGPSETVFGLIEYGAPAVAVVAVALSFVTARRRHGIVVPVIALVVIAAAAVALLVTF
jgi:hypothetical protein